MRTSLLRLPFWEFKRLAFGIRHTAEVDVTENCNLRCKHCYHFFGRDEIHKEDLPVDVWERRFAFLYESGVRLIMLVGGEPSLRIDVLMAAHRVFPHIFVITNGVIRIPDAFAHRLFVSIDGRKELNDSIRGEGVFEKVMANYEGDARVAPIMTLGEQNYEHLEYVVRLAKNSNFAGVVCNIYTPRNDGRNPWVLGPEARARVIAELRRVKNLYPEHLLVSRRMIDSFSIADHRGYCYWGDGVQHYSSQWKTRRCFGDNADCANCGCMGGAAGPPPSLILQNKEIRRTIYEG